MTAPAFAPGLEELLHPIAELKHYRRNPRSGDVDAIMASLRAHGQFRPLVVQRSTGEVLAGNHTLRAMRELGYEQAAVTWVDVDDDGAARIALVDNRANELASYDLQLLADAMQDLPDLAGTGWVDEDLERILADLQVPDGFTPGDGGGDGEHPDDGTPGPSTATCPGCSHTFRRPEPDA
jgi:hypothetical protein